MSGNGIQNYVNNQDGWNWRPFNQSGPKWWNNSLDQRTQWDHWWDQQSKDQWPEQRRPKDQWPEQRRPKDQWPEQRRPKDQWPEQRRPKDQWPEQRRPKDQWDRFYLTGRRLRNTTILVDPRGKIYILAHDQLFEVQTDPRGRVRIHRDRQDHVWILVRKIHPRDRSQLRTQTSLAELARANGIRTVD